MANTLDDKSGLIPYSAAQALRTVAAHPDLLTRLTLTRDDGWRSFSPLVAEAENRGGGREASDGTNIHLVMEALHHGMKVDTVPEPARSDGRAVFSAVRDMGFTIIGTEVFVVATGLPEPCAGTLDMLLRAPDGSYIIGDTKSVATHDGGKYSGVKWAIQTAIYNHGLPYDGKVGRDRWNRPQVNMEEVRPWRNGIEVRTDEALVLQVERGSATVEPYWVDTKLGWELADLACKIRAIRKRQKDLLLEWPEWMPTNVKPQGS